MPTVNYLGAGSTQIVAQCEGIDSNTCAVTVTGAAAGAFAHLPPGMTRLAETPFANVPVNSEYLVWTGTGMLAGQRYQYMLSGAQTALSLGSASGGAMYSPPSIQRHLFPAGMRDGDTPGGGGVSYWGAGGAGNYAELYCAFWIRFAPTVGGFQTHSVHQKLIYIPFSTTIRANQSFLVLESSGTTNQVQLSFLTSQALDDGSPPPGAALEKLPQATAMVPINTFAPVEFYMKLNTHTNDPAPRDGIFRMWVNNTLTHNYADIRYVSAANPLGFYRVKWDPVFGGNSGETIVHDQYIDLDHLYVAVR